MTTKTITITEDAYDALKGSKDMDESFSKAILRITHKKSLKEFVGVLSEKSGDKLEEAIKEMRRSRAESREKRIVRISGQLKGKYGSS